MGLERNDFVHGCLPRLSRYWEQVKSVLLEKGVYHNLSAARREENVIARAGGPTDFSAFDIEASMVSGFRLAKLS